MITSPVINSELTAKPVLTDQCVFPLRNVRPLSEASCLGDQTVFCHAETLVVNSPNSYGWVTLGIFLIEAMFYTMS